MAVLPVLFLLGSLFLCGRVEAMSETHNMLRRAALEYEGPLPCTQWKCECAFERQRSCCCAANDTYKLEEDTFMRIKHLWHDISTLNSKAQELTAGVKIAFKATLDESMANTDNCFGRFNYNVSIPYRTVSLNSGNGYNPSLGVFTALRAGVYAFSFTVYSSVSGDSRLYHKVQLMKNGEVVSSTWENNRDDMEDNASQFVLVELKFGDQVYVELMSGRKLCKSATVGLQYNIFTGYLVYPHTDE